MKGIEKELSFLSLLSMTYFEFMFPVPKSLDLACLEILILREKNLPARDRVRVSSNLGYSYHPITLGFLCKKWADEEKSHYSGKLFDCNY